MNLNSLVNMLRLGAQDPLNIIFNNTALNGGGINIYSSNSIRILDNNLFNNMATKFGSGIYIYES